MKLEMAQAEFSYPLSGYSTKFLSIIITTCLAQFRFILVSTLSIIPVLCPTISFGTRFLGMIPTFPSYFLTLVFSQIIILSRPRMLRLITHINQTFLVLEIYVARTWAHHSGYYMPPMFSLLLAFSCIYQYINRCQDICMNLLVEGSFHSNKYFAQDEIGHKLGQCWFLNIFV